MTYYLRRVANLWPQHTKFSFPVSFIVLQELPPLCVVKQVAFLSSVFRFLNCVRWSGAVNRPPVGLLIPPLCQVPFEVTSSESSAQCFCASNTDDVRGERVQLHNGALHNSNLHLLSVTPSRKVEGETRKTENIFVWNFIERLVKALKQRPDAPKCAHGVETAGTWRKPLSRFRSKLSFKVFECLPEERKVRNEGRNRHGKNKEMTDRRMNAWGTQPFPGALRPFAKSWCAEESSRRCPVFAENILHDFCG